MASQLPRAWASGTPEEWARRIGVPRLDLYSELPSTNVHLRALAEGDVPPLTSVIAGEQTAGRGREGRGWYSPPDAGLWLSILLTLDARGRVGVLPLAVGVAVALAIEDATAAKTSLKWPNDILIRSRKVAGILCESAGGSGRRVAVGIGVNLRRPDAGVPPQLVRTAGFLEELSGRPITEPDLARAIVGELRRWARPGPTELAGRLRTEWESRDRLRGRWIRLESGVVGVGRGVATDGSLRVELADRSVLAVRAGSVRLEGGPDMDSPEIEPREGSTAGDG